MVPQLAEGYGVCLIGEALGEQEAAEGAPFVGRAGHQLTRLIEWAGYDRAQFGILNAVWCKPPNNVLEGADYETGAVAHCRAAHWGHLLSRYRVLVPLGNVALQALANRKGILSSRGYVEAGPDGTQLVPTVHPSFIQRGQSRFCAAFINDLQRAVEVAREGFVTDPTDYTIDPLPREAHEWVEGYLAALAANPSMRLSYDIETPYKDEDESESELPAVMDRPAIKRIGLAYRPHHGLTVPWTPEYVGVVKRALASPGPKVGWNNTGFDDTILRAAGVIVNGLIEDGMIMWHILQSDLPKGLGFVATFMCPHQPRWKHLSASHPGYYNVVDADVTLRAVLKIESELRRTGMWGVYQRDVLDLDPVLQHMTRAGMPLDEETRYERAVWLADRQSTVLHQLEAAVPIEARRWSPREGYVRTPPDTTGLIPVRVQAPLHRCSVCLELRPTKHHFRHVSRPSKRPHNPCAGGQTVASVETITRFARLDPFKPSREQLMRYNTALGRMTPTTWDKRTRTRRPTMDEKAIQKLQQLYPLDPMYANVLTYRSLDKIAGGYIGRPHVEP